MYTASILWLLSYPQQIPTDVHIPNSYRYTASILWLLLYLGVQGKLRDAVSAENLQGVARPVVVCIILIMSSVGTVTGFFLKYLDSVRKASGTHRGRQPPPPNRAPPPATAGTEGGGGRRRGRPRKSCPQDTASRVPFAPHATTHFPQVVLATVLSWALFGTPLDAFTVLAALMVGLGVALYSRPVAAGGGGGAAGSGAGSGAREPEYKPVPSDDRATDGAAADDAEAPKRQV